MTLIPGLVDKLDSFEIVGLKIAEIILAETTSQQAIAVIDEEPNPDDWKVRVFSERSNPWGQFIDAPDDQSPLVNISYDSSTFDRAASIANGRQKADATYNIDCYAYGVSADDPEGGHEPGDKLAALNVHRALRLVRNWLMAIEHASLDLQGFVWDRWISSIKVFQPQEAGVLVQNIIAARIDLAVTFNETVSPAATEILEFLSVVMRDPSTGEVTIAQTDFDYTEE